MCLCFGGAMCLATTIIVVGFVIKAQFGKK